MAREISLSGGDISVLKALGLSGGQVGGKALIDRLGGVATAAMIAARDGLSMMEYVQRATAKLRDLRDALTPQKKENKPTRQRRG